MTGTIKTILTDRGFGFITVPNHRDVFFHRDDVSDELEFDQQLQQRRVEFEVRENDRGSYAVDIRPAE